MNTSPLFSIPRAGMMLETKSLQAIAYNFAIQNTLVSAKNPHSKARLVNATPNTFENIQKNATAPLFHSISIIKDDSPPEAIYDPHHPSADKNGYIYHPDINTVREMTTLIQTERAYESNLKMFQLAHQLMSESLRLGERS